MNNRTFLLDFISKEDFELHVLNTIKEYKATLKSINLDRFNNNIIDPIKLLFDKNVFKKSFEEIITFEIHRQRDKTNNNTIGYFHQKMFNYIPNCSVPKSGWDIIFNSDSGVNYYVEMKNKHNTMNSSSSAKTFMRFQNHLLTAKDRDNSVCVLVEVIAKKSSDSPWIVSIDGEKQKTNQSLRKMSIDKFYELVTGDKYSFLKMCKQLPITIDSILRGNKDLSVKEDSVLDELKDLNKDLLVSLYKLAFKTYEGFDDLF